MIKGTGSIITGAAMPESTPRRETDAERENPAVISLAGKRMVAAEEKKFAVTAVAVAGSITEENARRSPFDAGFPLPSFRINFLQ